MRKYAKLTNCNGIDIMGQFTTEKIMTIDWVKDDEILNLAKSIGRFHNFL